MYVCKEFALFQEVIILCLLACLPTALQNYFLLLNVKKTRETTEHLLTFTFVREISRTKLVRLLQLS